MAAVKRPFHAYRPGSIRYQLPSDVGGVAVSGFDEMAQMLKATENQITAARDQLAKSKFSKEVERRLGVYFGMVMAQHFFEQTDSHGRRWSRLAPATLKRKYRLNMRGNVSYNRAEGYTENRHESAGHALVRRNIEYVAQREAARAERKGVDPVVYQDSNFTFLEKKGGQKPFYVPKGRRKKYRAIHLTRSAGAIARFAGKTGTIVSHTIIPLVKTGVMFRSATSAVTSGGKVVSARSYPGLDIDSQNGRFIVNANIINEEERAKFGAHNRPVNSRALFVGRGHAARLPGREFFYLKPEDVAFIASVTLAQIFEMKKANGELLIDKDAGAFGLDPNNTRAMPSRPAAYGGAMGMNVFQAVSWRKRVKEKTGSDVSGFFNAMLDARTKERLRTTGAMEIIQAVGSVERAFKKRPILKSYVPH